MKPLPPLPYTRTLLTGQIQVIWEHLEKRGVYTRQGYICNGEVEAAIMLSNKTALWILQPLASWLRGQEHVAAVMELSNPYRKKYIGKLHKEVSAMLAQGTTMPHHVADWLVRSGLADFNAAMPGSSSKYYNGALTLGIYLQQFAEKYASAEKIPQP
ncbi:MAG: hypothetical protein LCH58_05970 [Bacteroidetes bacterium]|uniref:hypothetical protein n=1 Tax=Phnomibacter sp. TaxID=2836217 RepID=UPI002FDCE572|nr:hypothetical protein [Bacteroidota bacterium]